MTIVFNSNQFNIIKYTKYCFAPIFMPNKQRLHEFKQVSVKKALKTLKTKL